MEETEARVEWGQRKLLEKLTFTSGNFPQESRVELGGRVRLSKLARLALDPAMSTEDLRTSGLALSSHCYS